MILWDIVLAGVLFTKEVTGIIAVWKLIKSADFQSLQNIPKIPVRSIILYDKKTLLMAVDGAGIYAYDSSRKQTKSLADTDGCLW